MKGETIGFVTCGLKKQHYKLILAFPLNVIIPKASE